MPTLVELAGIEPLATSHGRPADPMQGRSLAAVLRDPANASPRREQYYECWANRAYYRDGWIAVSLQIKGKEIDFDNWTLHYHPEDFAEGVDVARQHPAKLKELVEAFDQAAWSNLVYPLDNRSALQKFNELPPHARPALHAKRRFQPGAQTVHRSVIIPLIADRAYRAIAELDHAPKDEGVIFAIGDVTAGMVLYIEAGEIRLVYNGYGIFRTLAAPLVASGKVVVAFDVEALGQRRGRGRLMVDDKPVTDWQELSPTIMAGIHEGLDIGLDRRGPVSWDLYERRRSFRYSGKIRDFVIESGPFAADSAYGKA
jgi:arylsulfatase